MLSCYWAVLRKANRVTEYGRWMWCSNGMQWMLCTKLDVDSYFTLCYNTPIQLWWKLGNATCINTKRLTDVVITLTGRCQFFSLNEAPIFKRRFWNRPMTDNRRLLCFALTANKCLNEWMLWPVIFGTLFLQKTYLRRSLFVWKPINVMLFTHQQGKK